MALSYIPKSTQYYDQDLWQSTDHRVTKQPLRGQKRDALVNIITNITDTLITIESLIELDYAALKSLQDANVAIQIGPLTRLANKHCYH